MKIIAFALVALGAIFTATSASSEENPDVESVEQFFVIAYEINEITPPQPSSSESQEKSYKNAIMLKADEAADVNLWSGKVMNFRYYPEDKGIGTVVVKLTSQDGELILNSGALPARTTGKFDNSKRIDLASLNDSVFINKSSDKGEYKILIKVYGEVQGE